MMISKFVVEENAKVILILFKLIDPITKMKVNTVFVIKTDQINLMTECIRETTAL